MTIFNGRKRKVPFVYIDSLGLCWAVAGLPPWLDTHVFMHMIQYHHVSSE
jgi:hypothetical protein